MLGHSGFNSGGFGLIAVLRIIENIIFALSALSYVNQQHFKSVKHKKRTTFLSLKYKHKSMMCFLASGIGKYGQGFTPLKFCPLILTNLAALPLLITDYLPGNNIDLAILVNKHNTYNINMDIATNYE